MPKDQLATDPLRGALFENWVLMEMTKYLANEGLPERIHFWRTHGGQEVDFLVEHEGRVIGVDAKAGMTARPSAARSLLNTLEYWPEEERQASVVFGGDAGFTSQGCRFLPWRQIAELYE